MNRLQICFIFVCATRLATAEVRELSPTVSFSLTEVLPRGVSLGQPANLEFHDSSVLVLTRSSNPEHPPLIVQTTVNGELQQLTNLDSLKVPLSLALIPDSDGATLAISGFANPKQKVLQYRSMDGVVKKEVDVPCASSEVVVYNGQAGTVCPNGGITIPSETGSWTKLTSWARPGAVFEMLDDETLAVVDMATGAILLNDLRTGAIHPIQPKSEALTLAQDRIDNHFEEGQAAAPSENIAKPSLIRDIAINDGKLYLLVAIYKQSIGPQVVVVDREGNATSEYVCRTPGDTTGAISLIAASGDNLALVSNGGDVLVFNQ